MLRLCPLEGHHTLDVNLTVAGGEVPGFSGELWGHGGEALLCKAHS